MVNSERGDQKNSHVEVGWAGQEMALDSAWRHASSWYERHLTADVTLNTPFPSVRRASLGVEHHATQTKYQQKVRCRAALLPLHSQRRHIFSKSLIMKFDFRSGNKSKYNN